MITLFTLLAKQLLHPFKYKIVSIHLTDGVQVVFFGRPKDIQDLARQLETAHNKRLKNYGVDKS